MEPSSSTALSPAEILGKNLSVVAQHTPAKRSNPEPTLTPEAPQKRTKFGGKFEKFSACKVCGCERDQAQRGAACDFCIKACRLLHAHQRVNTVLDQAGGEALKAKSVQLGASGKSQACKADDTSTAKLICKLEALVPRLEAALIRAETQSKTPGCSFLPVLLDTGFGLLA